jgi:hypothetical protein
MVVATIPADVAGESVFGLTRGQLVFSVIVVVVALLMYASGWVTRDMRCGCRTEQANAQRAIRRTLDAARRLEDSRRVRAERERAASQIMLDNDDVRVIPRGAPAGKRHRAELRETETRRTPVRHRARERGERWSDR